MLRHLIPTYPADIITNRFTNNNGCTALAISQPNRWYDNAPYFRPINYFCIVSALHTVNTCNPPAALARSHGIKSLDAIDLHGSPRKSMASQLQYTNFYYYHFHCPCVALKCGIECLRLIIRLDHEPAARQYAVVVTLLKRYRSVHLGRSVSICSGTV